MLKLVGHPLCPYVQRAAIVAAEKGVSIDRVTVDFAARPDWFGRLSPTGKVPLLLVDDIALFESAAIAEYLDETSEGRMLPADPITRAQHRAWVEYASGTLSDIAGLYSAPDAAAFEAKRGALVARFKRLEEVVVAPWFAGEGFGLVDAAFGPIFRYLDTFESLADIHLAKGLAKVATWRHALNERQSVRDAVAPEYPALLESFLRRRNSYLSFLIEGTARAA